MCSVPMGAPMPMGAPPPMGMAPAPMGMATAPPPMGMAPAPMGMAPAVGAVSGRPKAKAKPKKKTMAKKAAIKPKRKMKTLHWKPIADKKIVGTIWETVSKIEDEIVAEKAGDAFFAPKQVDEEKQKDGADGTSVGDGEQKKDEDHGPKREANTLEELFGAKPKRKKKGKAKGTESVSAEWGTGKWGQF